MDKEPIARVTEIPDGEGLRIEPPGHPPIALFRTASGIFALDDTCTHATASMSEGYVEDGEVECPIHQGRFDLTTGRALCFPVTEDLRTYRVSVVGDEVFVDLAHAADGTPHPGID